MALFNKNKKSTFNKNIINNNISLAKVIEKATDEPEFREIFYKRFLKENIYVIVQKDKNSTKNTSLESSPIVVLQNNNIPVFTEPERIFEHNAIGDEVDYIKVIGRSFLEMVVGETVIVNPFSNANKTLVPAEISDMLNGTIFNRISTNQKTKIQMDVMIGHPKVHPKEFIESLIPFLNKNQDINKAYLGWTFNPKIDKNPHYIIALDLTTNNCSQYANEIALIAKQYQSEDDILDIIQLEEGGTFSEFFYKQSSPFYIKENK
ncbi:enhanced serine sensitivity protein SseB C-terminal domain-containing protein [Myroides guanonis]|uniref:SseB protein N-terminal domain-containing protein n=1 Tax=Myroides guanonis TaxID=1150112 RepID=A0A1I3U6V3_9FLAO|nr:enhanced serine sensitivity protein SseB C-terminal domain-containing protein [Myroides guanonis]SFJ78309.1 SseB protein N-terminal domain-containing protein [Myroides guanonis]